jgi:hypothetical protein
VAAAARAGTAPVIAWARRVDAAAAPAAPRKRRREVSGEELLIGLPEEVGRREHYSSIALSS